MVEGDFLDPPRAGNSLLFVPVSLIAGRLEEETTEAGGEDRKAEGMEEHQSYPVWPSWQVE